jgi:hypothetical protein
LPRALKIVSRGTPRREQPCELISVISREPIISPVAPCIWAVARPRAASVQGGAGSDRWLTRGETCGCLCRNG